MGTVHIGLNSEFSRSSDKPFEWAVEHAAKMGYKWFEPMVHFGRELMSEAGYFHTVSMFDDPYRIKDACDRAGLTISGLQSHGPLGRPDVHGEYIKLAIRVAAEIGVPVVNTDEGIKAKWTTEEEDFVLIKYTLQEAAFIAERRGVAISTDHSDAERGKVTGTPVGCACGEGVLDGARIIDIVRRKCPRDIVFSVECGTPAQAAASLKHLSGLLK